MNNYRLHPLTGDRLEPIGVFRGRTVWPIMGGSEAATEAPPAQTPATPAAPGQPGQQGTPPATPAPQPPATPAAPAGELEAGDDDKAEDLAKRYTPAQLATLALRYRGEAGDRRAELRTTEQQATTAAEQARQQLLEQLKPGLQALGVLPADAEADPAKLAEDLAAKQLEDRAKEEASRTLQLENAVLRSAATAGANADRLLDSRSFATTLAGLDPDAPDFGDKVVAAIKAAVTKDATLRSTPAVRQLGAPLSGGSGENPRNTAPSSLADAVAAHYSQ